MKDKRVPNTHNAQYIPEDQANFEKNQGCDWHEDGEECGNSPAAWIGDIYFACREHYQEYKQYLEEL